MFYDVCSLKACDSERFTPILSLNFQMAEVANAPHIENGIIHHQQSQGQITAQVISQGSIVTQRMDAKDNSNKVGS